ncbi:MAG TPA: NAD(P)H-dependent oxidoreductase [Rhabdochlamydiaceae bacterium]|nr:NAD(P)H-dependent oxidoreductase [Rhabdochlamydiaceae bacterium]
MIKKAFLFAFLVMVMPLVAEVKVLAFAGSTRKDSYNKKLVQQAAEIARQKGAKVTIIDLIDYPMPLYDADLEAKQKLPTFAKKLRELMINNDAIMIASPEYNASISAVLKNALDWTSRGETAEYSADAYKGKKFAIMSASPGKMGGARGLVHLRAIIEGAGGEVIKSQVTVPEAHKAFDAKGNLVSTELTKKLQDEVQQLLNSVPASKGT